jgi:hypothetical protein
MNTHFKIFASYNILQYLCDFIHVLIFQIVITSLKMPNKSQINEYSDKSDWEFSSSLGLQPVHL